MTTEKVIKARWRKKRLAVKEMGKSLRKLRGRVLADIERGNQTALVVYLIMRTCERVGNAESATQGHYGVAYLQRKHVTVLPKGTIILHYVGKSGVTHHKEIDHPPPSVVKLIKHRLNTAGHDQLFDTSRKKVNAYLEPFNVTSKDIRGYNANELVKKQLSTAPKTNGKVTKKDFNHILKIVAAYIGHTPATLKNHYLLPEILAKVES